MTDAECIKLIRIFLDVAPDMDNQLLVSIISELWLRANGGKLVA